jgi:hypothetical protein
LCILLLTMKLRASAKKKPWIKHDLAGRLLT